ncbi:MAG TPA: hypothetical protein ENK60_00105 [Anaerolineae bacterium]|nr:hypothetical protein [Anaerolineae bacterium]
MPEREHAPLAKSSPDFWERFFEFVETFIQHAIAVILIAAAVILLGDAVVQFFREVFENPHDAVLTLLAALLLALMLVELLQTIRVSIAQHTLSAEPFLIVGIIASVRRMLIITAEQTSLMQEPETFRLILVELFLLAVTVILLSAAIYLLRKTRKLGSF